MYRYKETSKDNEDDLTYLIRKIGGLLENQGDKDAWKWEVWHGANLFPLVNVLESKDAYVITTQAPGLNLADLEIRIQGDTLLLQGERGPHEAVRADISYNRKERAQGRFKRSIVLPERVDYQEAHATYKNGTLTITIPRASDKSLKKIKITS